MQCDKCGFSAQEDALNTMLQRIAANSRIRALVYDGAKAEAAIIAKEKLHKKCGCLSCLDAISYMMVDRLDLLMGYNDFEED